MSDISVDVVYALPERQYIRTMVVVPGSTVEQIIVASGLLELCTDIDLKRNKVGVHGRIAKLGDFVNNDDRVEIYRPLIADPKELRRQRAERTKK